MPEVIYRPVKGGKFVAPHLKPGAVLDVSRREAEHLISTGAFVSAADAAPEPAAPEPSEATAAAKPAKPSRRKETR